MYKTVRGLKMRGVAKFGVEEFAARLKLGGEEFVCGPMLDDEEL